jgi:four helix bundle protein
MSKTAKTFKELMVWQKAHEFVLAVYHLTAKFPAGEIYCLTTQARRAAISIAVNIAEGFKKRGLNDETRFFNIAQGSLEECRYYLILAQCRHQEPGDISGGGFQASFRVLARRTHQQTRHARLLNFCILTSVF